MKLDSANPLSCKGQFWNSPLVIPERLELQKQCKSGNLMNYKSNTDNIHSEILSVV